MLLICKHVEEFSNYSGITLQTSYQVVLTASTQHTLLIVNHKFSVFIVRFVVNFNKTELCKATSCKINIVEKPSSLIEYKYSSSSSLKVYLELELLPSTSETTV